VNVLAVSDFMRTLFIILVATPFILLWGAALLDLIQGHHSGWAVVAWMIVILVIPIIGPMIYFAFRKPTSSEIDQSYLAARELERDRTAQRAGGIGVVP
jgi:K+-transporting ATPase A subunit